MVIGLWACDGELLPTLSPSPSPSTSPTPSPSPSSSPKIGRGFPQGLQDSEFHPVLALPKLTDDLNASMSKLAKCQAPFTNCYHGHTPVNWMLLVCEDLRKNGFDCGRHDDDRSRSDSGSDEIALRKSDDRFCEWEGYKIANYGNGFVIWAGIPPQPCFGDTCPGAYRGKTSIDLSYCNVAQFPLFK